ncbi:MAG: HhH-GPD family protein [Myxococcales bacterium]|nr:HhH-GPD family protein [Myxococcales bacterium]
MRLQVAVPSGFRLARVVQSHGWYDLPPFSWDDETLATAAHAGGAVHDLAIRERDGALVVEADPGGAGARAELRAIVETMLRLDQDLAPLYALTDGDARLSYAREAAVGRLLRAPTAFEDVIKMLLTTNCTWTLTRIMVTRLVDELGEAAPSGRRAFPTPRVMAKKNEKFYRDVVRAGYRAPHLANIAKAVVRGEIDPEAWRRADSGDAARDETLRKELLALPGIGPYAADNLLRLLGHYAYLGLDSWCRGRLKKLYPRTRDVDAFAVRRYKPFGKFAGLAMWLDLTRDWHDKEGKLVP